MGCKINYIDDVESIELIFYGRLTRNDFLEAYEDLYNQHNLYRQKYQNPFNSLDLTRRHRTEHLRRSTNFVNSRIDTHRSK